MFSRSARFGHSLPSLLACGALLCVAVAARADPELSETELLAIARHAPPAPEPAFDDAGGHIDDTVARHVSSPLTAYGREYGVPAAADGDSPPEVSLARRFPGMPSGAFPAGEPTLP